MAVLGPNDALGAYTIRSLIGTGGMGEVYRAHDERLDRFVAIKILRPGVTDEGSRARFSREARTVAKLRHPNVVPVFDVGEHDGLPFLVMELVEGPSLATMIHERRAVPLETKLRYVVDLCDALSHAHERGIIHRDVKPSNVLIDDNRVRLADFGIAIDTQSTITSVGGSPNYFAPEQLAGGGDHRADLFSLGALFYELLMGARAFPGSISDGVLYRIVHERAPVLPPHVGGAEMVEVVSRALEKDPDRRFQSAAEFKMAVAQASGATGATTGAATVLPQSGSDVTRFRRRLLESAAPAEVRRLKYEVDQYLAQQPYDVDGRMLSDEIERALVASVAPVPVFSPVTRGSSWRRPAAYASTIAIAVVAVSTLVMQRGAPGSTPGPVAPPVSPRASSAPRMADKRVPAEPRVQESIDDAADSPSPGLGTTVVAARPAAMAPGPAASVVSPPPAPSVPTPSAPTLPPASMTAGSPAPVVVTQPTPARPPPAPPAREESASVVRPVGTIAADVPERRSVPDIVAIREVIERYALAYARRDVAAARAAYPGVDARGMTATFDRFDTLRYTIQTLSTDMSGTGDAATVRAIIDQSGEVKTGGTESSRSPVTIRLRKSAGTWVIEGIDATPAPK